MKAFATLILTTLLMTVAAQAQAKTCKPLREDVDFPAMTPAFQRTVKSEALRYIIEQVALKKAALMKKKTLTKAEKTDLEESDKVVAYFKANRQMVLSQAVAQNGKWFGGENANLLDASVTFVSPSTVGWKFVVELEIDENTCDYRKYMSLRKVSAAHTEFNPMHYHNVPSDH